MRVGIYRRKPVTGLCNKSAIRFACPVASFALLLGCGGFARKDRRCGEKQFWLTRLAVVMAKRAGVPRARPRAEGRKRDLSLPLAVPAKNSRVGSFLLQWVTSDKIEL